MNIYLKNGTFVSGTERVTGDMLITNGIIAEVGDISSCNIPKNTEVLDCTGKIVTPGFIDAHTHYHLVSRGTVTADSFFEGSRLAAFGGVTTVVDFANHLPNETLGESAQARILEAQDMAIDYNIHQCVFRLPQNPNQELKELRELGITSIKVFTTYKKAGLYIEQDALESLFMACRDTDMLVMAHCEDDATVEELEQAYACKNVLPPDHADMRPPEAETLAIRWIANLCHRVGAKLYVVHLSSAQGLDEIKKLRKQGYHIEAETTPHYLFKDRSLLEGDEGVLYVMTPPLRGNAETYGLWQGVLAGDISIVATDHCAFSRDQKFVSTDPRNTFPGIPGTEEMFYMLYTRGVASGLLSMEKLVQLLSENPAKQFGLYPQKGSFEIGSDGDLTVIDPNESWEITHENQHSAAKYSAFHGETVKSRVTHTILRGRVIMSHGTFHGAPGDGNFIKGV